MFGAERLVVIVQPRVDFHVHPREVSVVRIDAEGFLHGGIVEVGLCITVVAP